MMKKKSSLDRRSFIANTGMAAAGLSISGCLTPNGSSSGSVRQGQIIKGRKLNIAAVGCGGKGNVDVRAVSSENIVALCDVDSARAAKTFGLHPNAKTFTDYRKMFEEMDDQIDAVTVTTPDHMHFPVALEAIKRGKHVYVQKPLTHTVAEARELTLAARKHKVVTQMGNQGHAGEGIRLAKEWVQAGVIGDVREVHVWTNRPIWPQGIKDPLPKQETPANLDWNKWLGVAPMRDYNEGYAPFKWRGWWDFGCGALGDMGCHLLDAAYWALELGYPTSVIAESKGLTDETAPTSSKVTYKFPARGDMPPVTVIWYDGGEMPPRPDTLEKDRKFSKGGGQLIVGSKGTIMDQSSYCSSPRLIPETAMQDMLKNNRIEKTIPRVPKGNPYQEWILACKGEGPTPGSNFDYAGPFSEMILMGNLAVRLSGQEIKWNGEKMHCSNLAAANELVHKPYRKF